MKRLLAVFFVIGGMALVGPAAPAFGRGDGWQPAPFTPFDASCGEITVHVTAPVNKEYFKETVLEDGTVQDTITGSFRLNYTTDFGKSVTVNSSGPGDLLFRQSGDLEIVAQGLDSFAFTAEQAETLGVPQISVSAGPMDITFHTDGTVSGHMGNIIEDVCAELTG